MRKSSSRMSSVMVGKANSSRLVMLKMYASLQALFYTKKQAPVAPPKKENPPKKKRTPFKTIIIDPTKNTKIYFKPPNDD